MNEIAEAFAVIESEVRRLARPYFRGNGPDCELYNHLFAYLETSLCGYVYRLRYTPNEALAQEVRIAVADFDGAILRHKDRAIGRPLRDLIVRFEVLHAAMLRRLA